MFKKKIIILFHVIFRLCSRFFRSLYSNPLNNILKKTETSNIQTLLFFWNVGVWFLVNYWINLTVSSFRFEYYNIKVYVLLITTIFNIDFCFFLLFIHNFILRFKYPFGYFDFNFKYLYQFFLNFITLNSIRIEYGPIAIVFR